MVDSRETVVVSVNHARADGSVILAAKSCDYGPAPASGVTRAELVIGAWLLVPETGKPEQTRAVYISQVDPKGSIPKSLVGGKMKENGQKIAHVRAAMKKKLG
jgi:hypothetical protein